MRTSIAVFNAMNEIVEVPWCRHCTLVLLACLDDLGSQRLTLCQDGVAFPLKNIVCKHHRQSGNQSPCRRDIAAPIVPRVLLCVNITGVIETSRA